MKEGEGNHDENSGEAEEEKKEEKARGCGWSSQAWVS